MRSGDHVTAFAHTRVVRRGGAADRQDQTNPGEEQA